MTMSMMNQKENEQLAARWTAVQPVVGAFIGSVVGDFHQAEEILQRVAVVLVRKFAEYDPKQSFAAWAISVAKFEILYFRRQHATDRHYFDTQTIEKIAAGHQKLEKEYSSARQALRECLKKVQGKARQAIELRYSQGVKPAAVAQSMGMGAGAARMLLMRARLAIRDCVQRRMSAGETI